jgi:hypothetical protein
MGIVNDCKRWARASTEKTKTAAIQKKGKKQRK